MRNHFIRRCSKSYDFPIDRVDDKKPTFDDFPWHRHEESNANLLTATFERGNVLKVLHRLRLMIRPRISSV